MVQKKTRPALDVLRHWAKTIEEDGQDLTKWELDFIQSVYRNLARGWGLTEKQEDKLESIYAEKT